MTGKQLKNSILQLAIQGKLVPQDPADEPASELLKRIRKEKEQLVKDGKLKKKDLVSEPIADEDKPFEIPEGWEWCRLFALVDADCSLGYGIVQPMEDIPNGIPIVRPVDMNHLWVTKQGLKRVDPKISDAYQRTILKGGEILFCVRGTVGKISIATPELAGANVTRGISPIRISNKDTLKYVFYVLFSPETRDKIKEFTKGAALQQINVADLKNLLIPLPPLPEQHRIVAKIEELMPLVEEYDKAQTQLDALNASLPEALKKSILQQAIQGKLVPQDPNDEPASVLLKRIRKEKEQLVKDGKLKKKDLVTTPISDEDKPFEIPKSWEWVRFEDIAQGLCGKTPERGNQDFWLNPKYPWVSISDMTNYGHVKSTKEGISEKAAVIMRKISNKGDLLMSFKLTVGRTSILDIDAYHNEAIITVKPLVDKDNCMRNYLFRLLPIITANGDSKDAIKGRTLNAKSIATLIIPLPPLPEQHRIVAKIEELFAALK